MTNKDAFYSLLQDMEGIKKRIIHHPVLTVFSVVKNED
jgi:hypothetical protein